MAVLETKRCPRCEQTKPLGDFYKDKSRKDGLYPNCKSCHMEYTNAWRSSDAGQIYTRNAKYRKYQMTESDYKIILAQQENSCAICGSTTSGHNMTDELLIDHDHTSGNVRGLLCVRCNAGIGHFMDDPDLLRSAVAYLERA